MAKSETKDGILNMRLPAELDAQLERKARAAYLTKTAFVRLAILAAVKGEDERVPA